MQAKWASTHLDSQLLALQSATLHIAPSKNVQRVYYKTNVRGQSNSNNNNKNKNYVQQKEQQQQESEKSEENSQRIR